MLFKDYLTKLKTNGSLPQSLIVNTLYCCDYDKLVKTYLKTLACAHTPFCNECDICKRIDKNAYVDVIYITNDETLMKKEEVLNIQDTFNAPSTETAGVKLYAIKDVEKTKKETLNSMLKFLEDAPTNTYALFLTTNANRILPTIRSRSNIITITDTEMNLSGEDDEEYNNVIKTTFGDFNEFKRYDEEHNFYEKYELAQQCISASSPIDIISASKIVSGLSRNDFAIVLRTIASLVSPEKRNKIEELVDNIRLNINQKTTTILLFEILKGN